jgi:hypothetical protein
MMKLDRLKSLYIEMKEANEDRQQFEFEYNGVLADVFLFIDQQPFIMAFGIKLTQTYFEVPVKPGFIVNGYLDKELLDIIIEEFHIEYNPNHKYSPLDFLQAVNKQIPQTLKETRPVTPRNIAHYHRNVEDADKLYFCGFLDNSKARNKVTNENLIKTRLLMGEEAYQRCKRENLSTKWTDAIGKDKYRQWRKLKPEA